MNCSGRAIEADYSEFVEVDPTGRYGRYNEILGKGASKTVYKAFDEYEGIEVAWNQVKLHDFLQNPEDLERLYCEIHLLKTLKHDNIMKFYTSWVDIANRNINFVTEMFTSGTLRQYRLKHRRVNIRAVKNWCRQILEGLLYLHNHKPPVIHRDLKCDNIFINGNQGEVKIGDLGLAGFLRKSHAVRCVGTPEFMAPEVYEEEYNELVDIYSFGMCILEMVTFEYPYSECNHPAQIYKKVMTGTKPEALSKVKDPEVRQFVEKCLAAVSYRLPARELLKDSFLQLDDYGFDLRPIDYYNDYEEAGPLLRQPLNGFHQSDISFIDECSSYSNYYPPEHDSDYHLLDSQLSEVDLFTDHEDEDWENVDISIKGRRRREDDGIFLRLRMADKEGRIRNIYFPFDIENDTALEVATEMVSELDITDQDVEYIADMIDGEISKLVPEWKKGLNTEENVHGTFTSHCQNCASNPHLSDYVSSSTQTTKNLEVLNCSKHGCASIHGRFEEITYQLEGPEKGSGGGGGTDGAPPSHFADIWAQRDGPEVLDDNIIHEMREKIDTPVENDEKIININMDFSQSETVAMNDPINMEFSQSEAVAMNDPSLGLDSDSTTHLDDYENEIRQELRWLKAKYQMQMMELRGKQLGVKSGELDHTKDDKSSILFTTKDGNRGYVVRSLATLTNNEIASSTSLPERIEGSFSPEAMFTAKNFYTGGLLQQPLLRATSLPVDAVDV